MFHSGTHQTAAEIDRGRRISIVLYPIQTYNYGAQFAGVTAGTIALYTAYTFGVTQWRYVPSVTHK